MSKRTSAEEVIVGYFSNEAQAKVEVVYNIVRGVMKQRGIVGRKAVVKKAGKRPVDKGVELDMAVAQ